VLGPMSGSLAGVRAFMRAVIDARPWTRDPLAVRKSWDEDAYQLAEHGGPGGKLCVAVMWDDGKVVPHPPVRRGLEMAKQALLAAGHRGACFASQLPSAALF
jgi:amidase